MSEIRTIYWEDEAVFMIDQKALPEEERYVACRRYEDVIAAIEDMTIRGAPAIGIAAAMGIAVGALHLKADDETSFRATFLEICDAFSRSRPTARNLFWAVERMKKRFETAMSESGKSTGWMNYSAASEDIKKALVAEAVDICKEDVAVNKTIGFYGKSLIADQSRILTHCNAGALATGGYGTALGVIRAARDEGKKVYVVSCETRPVLQGARLTAWELIREEIPVTLITDGTAGSLMHQGKIDLVIVGADRIAANGDTANKIGTYSLAVLAKANKVPFYVAAPLSTFDPSFREGRDIIIEERDKKEVLMMGGRRIAPPEVKVYNPAFDVTPNRYVTAFITEAGIIRRPFTKEIRNIFLSPGKA